MRPVVLEVEGFGAFRRPTTVAFDDTDFFALVGPTGSGKSTVIDAVCFALYGSVPRYDDQRLVGSAVSLGHNELKVRLTFDVGDQRYVAARVVRRGRDGRATTKEARLEGPGGRVLAGKASEMPAAVEALLGLSFEHFTRCVVLPQGEFARFLHDRPAERQELLVRLLDLGVYERLAAAANRRAQATELEIRLAEDRLARLADVTPDAVAHARARRRELTDLLGHVETEAAVVAALDAEVATHRAEVETRHQHLDALARVAVPPEVRTLGRAVDDREADVAAARAALADAEAATAAARANLATLPAVAELRAVLAAHDRLAAASQRTAEAVTATGEAEARVAAAVLATSRAAAESAAAEARLAAARREHAAHALRLDLSPGEPCPVCLVPVDHVPALDAPPELAVARAAAEHAAQEAAAAGRRERAAEQALAAARAERSAAERERAELLAAVAAHPERGPVEVLLTEVQQEEQAVERAERAEQVARRSERAAVAARDEATRRLAEAARRYHAQRDPLVALGAPLPAGDLGTVLVAAWDELAAWAENRRPEEERAVQAAERAVAALVADRAERWSRVAERVADAGVEVPTRPERLRDAVQMAVSDAASRVTALERDLAEVAERQAAVSTYRAEAMVARRLAQLLSASGFERWLVQEALHELVAGASSTLERLSGGQYSLALDDAGGFEVIDHASGDERRNVRTLSGGETFQASLALALALADHLAGLAVGGTARLEAIFLDEGFGTLDADSLETVAETVEALGTSGRMVGIVTHVRELAARVPVRFEVRRGPTTATIERVVG